MINHFLTFYYTEWVNALETNNWSFYDIKYNLCTPFKHDSRCALFSLLSFVTTNSPQREAQRMSCLKGVHSLYVTGVSVNAVLQTTIFIMWVPWSTPIITFITLSELAQPIDNQTHEFHDRYLCVVSSVDVVKVVCSVLFCEPFTTFNWLFILRSWTDSTVCLS